MGLFNLQAVAAGTCSSTFQPLSGPASARLRRDKLSSTRSRAIGGRSRRSTSRSNDHFADETRRAYRLSYIAPFGACGSNAPEMAAVLIGKRSQSRSNPVTHMSVTNDDLRDLHPEA